MLPHRFSLERVEAEKLLRRALHDGVTGLPNRVAFLDDVGREIEAAIPGKAVQILAAVALDQLAKGELSAPPSTQLLNDIAVTATVRRDDTLARIGEQSSPRS